MKENELKNENEQTITEFLEAYHPGDYERPSVTLDIAVMTSDKQILMIQRRNHPNIGKWALPGGFLNMDEELYDGALRELKEETNAENLELIPLGMFGGVHRDPRTRIITTAFASIVDKDSLAIQAGDDAQDALWFNIEWQKMGICTIPKTQDHYPNVLLPCNAYGQPMPKEAESFLLRLTNKQHSISASAMVALDAWNNPILLSTPDFANRQDEAIAGDHALIIASAIQKCFGSEL